MKLLGECLEPSFYKLAVLECQNHLFDKGFVTVECLNPLFYKGFVTTEIPHAPSTPSAPFWGPPSCRRSMVGPRQSKGTFKNQENPRKYPPKSPFLRKRSGSEKCIFWKFVSRKRSVYNGCWWHNSFETRSRRKPPFFKENWHKNQKIFAREARVKSLIWTWNCSYAVCLDLWCATLVCST